jgi:hypothetical protein
MPLSDALLSCGGSPGPARPWWALVALLLLLPAAAHAHGATAGSMPLASGAVTLKHRRPAEIVALFARERLPEADQAAVPRAARAGVGDSLLPEGVDAIMRSAAANEVVMVGAEDRFPALAACLHVIDVPVETVGADRVRVVLALYQAAPQAVRRAVIRLPDAGSALAAGSQLTLEGSAAWVHQALRQVIRAELKLAPAAHDTALEP